MQRLKGLSVLIPFILSGIIILTGCGQEEASGGVTDVTDALFLSENEAEESESMSSGETGTTAGTTAPVSEIAASQEQGKSRKARKLTDEECRELQNYINDTGSYGFLLSVYEKPQDLDAEQVFFTGAGLELITPTAEEREAYREITGGAETVNLFGISAQQATDYLQYKAGVSLDELTHKPDWIYLEDYDTYYQCHGDEETNICEYEVTDAAVQGDYYRVHYRVRRYAPDLDGGLLLGPYCEVETEKFGKVKFCAYKPDNNASEKADVDFFFIRDSEILCRLGGMDSRNIRTDRIFRDVDEVDLGDYDGDGRSEIVTICEYEITKEGNGRQDGREARIYRFDEDGNPRLDKELTARINSSVSELSLSGIAHYVKTGKDREKFGGRFEAYAAEAAEADPDSYNKFALIYVNDDRFPELLELGTSADKGAKIVFYRDGVLQETKVSSTFSYLNKENLLLNRSGTGNLFTDQIYVYTGSRFEAYQSGVFGTMDAAVTAYTKSGKPEYSYKWEGSTVSEAGYHDAIGFIYDEKDAIDPTKIEMKTAEEFLQSLKK